MLRKIYNVFIKIIIVWNVRILEYNLVIVLGIANYQSVALIHPYIRSYTGVEYFTTFCIYIHTVAICIYYLVMKKYLSYVAILNL